jgi:hypothetical protein
MEKHVNDLKTQVENNVSVWNKVLIYFTGCQFVDALEGGNVASHGLKTLDCKS